MRQRLSPVLPRITSGVLFCALSGAAGAATFVDKTHGFRVDSPPGWTQKWTRGAAVLFNAPRRTGTFLPSINVLVQPLKQPLTQAQYHNRSLQNLSLFITDGKVISTGQLTFGGLKGNQTTYTGRQGTQKMYYVSTYAVRGRNVYVITGTTLRGSGSEAELKKALMPFLKSFKFTR